ncbi:MAG: sulfatase-like hydrolase/transferase [Desulfuromonadaceae bacterium]|nr:sulfatase-like hydrolase/transferase [Desulfuromonadaceae bacterium]
MNQLKIKTFEKTYTKINLQSLCVFGLIISPLFSHYIYAYFFGFFDFQQLSIYIFNSLFSLLIFAPVFLVFGFRLIVWLSFSIIFLFVSSLETAHFFIYGVGLNRATFFSIFQTNFFEANEYVSDFAFKTLKTSPFILMNFLLMYVFYIYKEKITYLKFNPYFYIVMLFMLPVFFFNSESVLAGDNIIFKAFSAYAEYQNEIKLLKNDISKSDESDIKVSLLKEYQGPEVHVVIIGESTNRKHMALYGYQRKTTPHLSSKKGDLYVYKNVLSTSAETLGSLRHVLTFKDHPLSGKPFLEGNIIQYIKKAGYDTYWISNQVPLGLSENPVTLIAKSSDHVIFVNNNVSHDSGSSYDEKVIGPLKNILRADNGKKFVFIHLLGSHTSYKNRYPDNFSVFQDKMNGVDEKQSDIINQYDNSVLYNDYIINEIISETQKANKYSFIMYFSDHGENVYDCNPYLGHNPWQTCPEMLEVPYIMWFSDKYKKNNSEKMLSFDLYLDRKYFLSKTINSIYDLLNFNYAHYEDHKSIFSDDFEEDDFKVINKIFKQNIY